MTSFAKAVTWDCADALTLARFWAAVLGTDVDEDSTSDKAFVEAAGWGGPNMWFVRVPEPKSAKNRIHFDLRPLGSRGEEVARLIDLGATVVEAFDSHTVMRDPEGNEFCVEPGPSDTPGPGRGMRDMEGTGWDANLPQLRQERLPGSQ